MKTNVETKKAEAKVRQEAYDKLTVKQKIEKLDKKFGVGLGAKKERARLLKKGEQTKQEVKPEKIVVKQVKEKVKKESKK